MRAALAIFASLLLLTACGSGKEASTAGMPGIVNGKKVHPTVKLGKPYSISGRTYYPEYDPNYTETGMASWYGPGFHGGSTANGERFSTNQLTAAHRTLPMPSIVKVTLEKTGKSAIVRINDRGPFAHGRIIDLSRAAADKIGLTPMGVGKVRVEYLPAESQRFADLLSQGRDPQSIDVASEVLPYSDDDTATQIAANEIKDKANRPTSDSTWWDHVSPVSSAHAATPHRNTPMESPSANVPTEAVTTRDLAAPVAASSMAVPPPMAPVPQPRQDSVFAAVERPVVIPPSAAPPPAAAAPVQPRAPDELVHINPVYIQLGSFSHEENAVALVKRVMPLGEAGLTIMKRDGMSLYRVRLGPYDNPEMAEEMLQRVHQAGLKDARFVRQ
jgi:rare lipoprotein A